MTPKAKATIRSIIWTDFFLSNAYLSHITRHSSSRLPWGWSATEKRYRYFITYCPTRQNLCISCTDLSKNFIFQSQLVRVCGLLIVVKKTFSSSLPSDVSACAFRRVFIPFLPSFMTLDCTNTTT